MHSNTTELTLTRIETIRRVYRPGMTAKQIAEHLGAKEGQFISRNTVIGIYSRNRDYLEDCPLPPSGRDIASPKRERAPNVRKPRAARAKPATKPKPAVSNVVPFRLPVQAFEYVATHPTKRLLDLQASECKWPMSGAGADTQFCSQHAEGSYCDHHRLMSIGRGTEGERTAGKTLKRYG